MYYGRLEVLESYGRPLRMQSEEESAMNGPMLVSYMRHVVESVNSSGQTDRASALHHFFRNDCDRNNSFIGNMSFEDGTKKHRFL